MWKAIKSNGGAIMTKRQAEVLAFVRTFMAENGKAPSLVEIGAAIGAHKVTARSLLIRLHEKGYIIREPAIRYDSRNREQKGAWRNIRLPEWVA
jgi:SOS-response transcriptional repressor LexA